MDYKEKNGSSVEFQVLPDANPGDIVTATLEIRCGCSFTGDKLVGIVVPDEGFVEEYEFLTVIILCPKCDRVLGELSLGTMYCQ